MINLKLYTVVLAAVIFSACAYAAPRCFTVVINQLRALTVSTRDALPASQPTSLRVFETFGFSRSSFAFRHSDRKVWVGQVNAFARELDGLSTDAASQVIALAEEIKAIPNSIFVTDVSNFAGGRAIGNRKAYGLNEVSFRNSDGETAINEILKLPKEWPLERKLEIIRSEKLVKIRSKIEGLFDFDRLRASQKLISSDGRLELSDAWVHRQADLAEKLAKVIDLKKYTDQSDLLEKFAEAIRLTRQDAYSGRNHELLELTLQEAGGDSIGIRSTKNTIASVIATRRYLAGDLGTGLWTPAEAAGKFTADTSLFPVEALYGKGAERKVFWVLKAHDHGYDLNPEIKVRVGWGQPDLDEMRVVVNHARDDKGNLVPVTLEALVPSGDKNRGPEPFFFKNVNGEWIPQRFFQMPGGKQLPVERACLVCHERPGTNAGVLAPLPMRLIGDDGSRLRSAGGYNPEVIDHVLEYIKKPY